MYQAHFGLTAAPFSITPDPQYLYLSERHREALAHLLYGVNESPGFVLLTGEVGTGKTTLCRCLIEQLPDNVDVALLLNPRLSPLELLAALFDELRIHYDAAFSLKDFIDTLNTYLLTAHTVGHRTVVILDEAQNLSPEVLEQLRLLTNLETTQQKLLQIILVGQPELQKILKRSNLRQLSQRITARYHLLPLVSRDTQAYINHRLAISGAREPIFTRSAIRKVYQESGGIPRLINIICDRALLGGYVNNRSVIDKSIVRRAVCEVTGAVSGSIWLRDWPYATLSSALAGFIVAASTWWWLYSPQAQSLSPEPSNIEHPIVLPAESESIPMTVGELSEDEFSTLTETESMAGVVDADAVTATAEAQAAADEGLETTEETQAATLTEDEIALAIQTPPPEALSQLLRLEDLPSDTDTAFVHLFELWDKTYQPVPEVTACEYAAEVELACLYKTGNWGDLRLYNRPAVIELITDTGEQHHVVVTRLQDNSAVLDIGGQNYQFDLKTINDYWLGQLLLFWQPANMPVPKLGFGMRGEEVIWLRRKLATAEGTDLNNVELSNRYDRALRQQVVDFQKKYGLQVDGIAGEETQLMLDALVGAQPTLTPR